MPGFNINSFIKGSPEEKMYDIDIIPEAEAPKKKRATKKKAEEVVVQQAAPPVPQTSMSYLQENIPYATAYMETTRQLDDSINQLNALGRELVSELDHVRHSKTLRNKYNLITEMTSAATTIVNSQITAIREKNNIINGVMKLELDRVKTLKSQAGADEDDNTRIANLYDAFINTPIGGGRVMLGPSAQDMVMAGGAPDLARMSIGGDQIAWEQGLDPAQNRMLLEAKGSIDTVVMYDEASGNRWFEIVDKVTRQPIPNVEKPDSSYIYDLDINIRGGYAKDGNRNIVYPLVVISEGGPSNDILSKY